MAAELLAFVHEFDEAFIVKNTMEKLLNRTVDLCAFVDTRTTSNWVAKQASTSENRFQIDGSAIKQAYTNGEITKIGWVCGDENPADGLTRKKILTPNHPL